MKITFFNDWRLGVLKGDTHIVDVTPVVAKKVPHVGPHDLIAGVIENWDKFKGPIAAAVKKGKGVPLAKVKLRAPLPRPINIACMAVNYMENGTRSEPAEINAFNKAPGAIIGTGDTMVLPDVPATIFEGEAEMALVIGKRATNVPLAQAMDYIFGYVNFIDGSARGLTAGFYQMKSRDTFAPVGPYIVTKDEIADPQRLAIKLWVNGTLMQDFNTDDMGHKIPRCVEFVSAIHALEPGDILATGTNHRGLNAFQDGDTVELECEGGLGRLTIKVRDDAKRTWTRETRLERQNKGLDPLAPQLSGKYFKAP